MPLKTGKLGTRKNAQLEWKMHGWSGKWRAGKCETGKF